MSRNILLLCYMISPSRGSEYSVAWNYVSRMSAHNKLTVLYGTSGNHMGDCEEIEKFAQEGGLANVRFCKVPSDSLCKMLNSLNVRGVFRYTFYFAFRRWQRLAYRQARELCAGERYDLIHYLGPIGYREPGFLYKLDLPYIWGPVGGTVNYPYRLFEGLPLRDKLKYFFRNLSNSIQLRFSLRVRRAMHRADILFASTRETRQTILKNFGRDALYLPENGITGKVSEHGIFLSENEPVNCICVGRLDSGKNFIMALEALSRVERRSSFRLHIVGDGPGRTSLEKFVKKKGMEEIVMFYGNVPRPQVGELFIHSHLHIITSIGEGNPTVLFEAMAAGVPTLTLDHCGMHDVVTDECGYPIAVTTRKRIIDDITSVLNHIDCNRKELITKSEATLTRCRDFMWDKRIDVFENCYDQAIRKKIVCYHLRNDFSGSAKVLSLVIAGLKAKSYDVRLCTSGAKGCLSQYNQCCKSYSYNLSNSLILNTLRYLCVQFETFFGAFKYKKESNVVFYINTLLPVGPALAAKVMGKKIIYHYHECAGIKGVHYRLLARIMQSVADTIICVSDYQASLLKRKDGVVVIENALPSAFIARLHPDSDRAFKSKTVLMLSALREYKGISPFFTLARTLNQYSFVLVLDATPQETSAYLKKRNMSVPANLTIFSGTNDVCAHYNNASIVINLSDSSKVVETFGLTALEGMAAGLPVIVPSVGGIADLVDEGVCGFKIDSSDIQAICKAISKLLSDKILYEQMSANALMKASQYDEKTIIDKIDGVLCE